MNIDGTPTPLDLRHHLSISPFIFQNGLKLNAAQYGTIITLPAIGYFMGNFLPTRLIRFFDSEHLVFVGALIVVMVGIALALEAAFNGLSTFSVITPLYSASLALAY